MKLPGEFQNNKEWTLVGPMGPKLPALKFPYPLLGIDGGARFCDRMDIWVGDGDSHLSTINSQHIFEFSPQKNSSDLALALSLFQTSGPMRLHCWGLLGGRRDHELLNLGEMMHFLENSPQSRATFYDSQGIIALECVSSGSWSFTHQGIFSLTCIKESRVTLTGCCDYLLKEVTSLPPLSSLGLSNSASGEFFLTNSSPVMIFFTGVN